MTLAKKWLSILALARIVEKAVLTICAVETLMNVPFASPEELE
jgi:hypothetical protein